MLGRSRFRSRARFLGGASAGFDVNFLTGTLDPRITFTRSTIATYTGSDGLVKTAAINEPRFDYDPTTLQPRGLLIEEPRTNIVLHSSDLTQTDWVKTNATVAMTATGPDGAANSATTVTATAGNATVLQAFVLVNAQRNTSVYIKRRTGTGTVQITQTGGTSWTTVTVTAGWTRVSLPGGNVVNPSVGLRIVTSGDAVDVALFQCESGLLSAVNVPTSAIPTGASQVTRTGDVALITGTNFSSWYNQTEGSMLAVFSSFAASTNSQSVYAVSSGSSLTRWSAELITGVQHNVSVTTSQASITVGTFATNTIYKSAFGVRLNSMQAAVNNVQGTEDTVGTMPTVNRLSIGSNANANANFLVGHIRSLTYYPTRLTNAELQALTV